MEKKLTKNNKHKQTKMKNLLFGLFMGLTSICQSQWNGNVIHINGCNAANLPKSFTVGDSVYYHGDTYSWNCSGGINSDPANGILVPDCNNLFIYIFDPVVTCNGWIDYNSAGIVFIRVFPILSTSINEVQNFEFKMFPNPSNDILTIQVENRSKLDMFSTSGQLIMTMMVNYGSNSVDLSDVPTGVYMVKIDNVTKQLIRL